MGGTGEKAFCLPMVDGIFRMAESCEYRQNYQHERNHDNQNGASEGIDFKQKRVSAHASSSTAGVSQEV